MEETITLKEVLDQLDSGAPFVSMVFITYNKRHGDGGERVCIGKGWKHNWLSKADYKKQQLLQPASKGVKRDPNHYENSTRNIYLAKSGEIRKVHIRLIRRFNSKIVL